MSTYVIMPQSDTLQHFGVKGMTWNKHKYLSAKNINGKINYVYNNAVDKYLNFRDNNELITGPDNYTEKIKDVEASDEFQDIIKRQDSEYMKTDENGKTYYDVDDYLVKKKHPVLDVLDDVVSGRDIHTNKITKKSVVAGLNDYAQTGIAVVAALTKFSIANFKAHQGTYYNSETKKQMEKQKKDREKQGRKLVMDAMAYANTYNY